jgi:hypothetical protein
MYRIWCSCYVLQWLVKCFKNLNQRKEHNKQWTTWSRVLLEKITVPQLAKKFPAFLGYQMSITVLTRTIHLSLFQSTQIQSTISHPVSLWHCVRLCSHLCLGLSGGLLPSCFPNPIYTSPLHCHIIKESRPQKNLKGRSTNHTHRTIQCSKYTVREKCLYYDTVSC